MGFTTTLQLSSFFFFFLNLPSPYSPRRLPAPQLLTKADVEVDLVNLQRRESIMSHDNKI